MFWRKKEPKLQPIEITDYTFNDIIPTAEVPVLVDFYASWCGPCKMLAPFITELANEYDGRAIIAKIDVEKNPQLAAHFKVKSIPTLMFFHRGRLQDTFNGVIPKPNMEEILDMYISGDYIEDPYDEEE